MYIKKYVFGVTYSKRNELQTQYFGTLFLIPPEERSGHEVYRFH